MLNRAIVSRGSVGPGRRFQAIEAITTPLRMATSHGSHGVQSASPAASADTAGVGGAMACDGSGATKRYPRRGIVWMNSPR